MIDPKTSLIEKLPNLLSCSHLSQLLNNPEKAQLILNELPKIKILHRNYIRKVDLIQWIENRIE